MKTKKKPDVFKAVMNGYDKERAVYRTNVMQIALLLKLIESHNDLSSLAKALLAENNNAVSTLCGVRERIDQFLTDMIKRTDACKGSSGKAGGN